MLSHTSCSSGFRVERFIAVVRRNRGCRWLGGNEDTEGPTGRMTRMSNHLFRNALLAAAAAFALAACSSAVVREAAPKSLPRYGASTLVQRGDTVYRIATSNGISPLDLAMWNGIRAPYTIYPGQRLMLYPGAVGSSRPAPERTVRTPAPTQRATSRPAAPVAAPSTPAPISSNVGWRWPADGALIKVRRG